MIFPILGSIALVFRIWLVESKLRDELEFRGRYVSRMLNLYFFIAMILDFQNSMFNFLFVSVAPILLISFIGWDLLFFKKFKTRTYWKKNHGWLIVERITLHPPVLIAAIIMYANGFWNYFDPTDAVWTIIIAAILGFGPFFAWDDRWTRKYIPPTGVNILLGSIASIIGTIIYVFAIMPNYIP